jgi:hypothetical protein
METQSTYKYLVQRADKRTQERFIRDTGVRASTIWHDRYISRMTPQCIARNRSLPVAAVLEALAYCQDHWEMICAEKDEERTWLEQQRFFAEPFPAQP